MALLRACCDPRPCTCAPCRGSSRISTCIRMQFQARDRQGQAVLSPPTPQGFGKGCTFSSLLMFRVEVLQVMEGMGSPDASQVSVI